MNKNHRNLIIIAVVVVLLCIGMGAIYEVNKPETEQGGKTITVTVVHEDGTEKEYTYNTDEEYLAPVLVDAGLIEGSDSQYGLYVETVDGETADYNTDQSYWCLMDGDEEATTGADSLVITDGGTYSWVYTAD